MALPASFVASTVALIEECLITARNAAGEWSNTRVRLHMTYCIYVSDTP